MGESHEDDDHRIVLEMIGRFGAPSFMRRAKLVESAWTQLLTTGAKARLDRLIFVRLRLGQVLALAGSWETLQPWLADADDLAVLQRLHDELPPRLRLPLEPTTSRRVMRSALRELLAAIDSFNQRWGRWLAQVDLTALNKAREDYNRFYLFEKEIALGSARLANLGFQWLEPITLADVAQQLPLLVLPRFVLD